MYLVVLCILTFLGAIVAFFKWSFTYWKRRNVPYLEPRIPFGTSADHLCGKENFSVTLARCYKKMKGLGWKHGGIYLFSTPIYVPISRDYLKNMFSKDFRYFTDRALYYHEKKDTLNGHLVNISGPKWRILRPKLNPYFSIGKTKLMFQSLVECQSHVVQKVSTECAKNEPVNIKDVSTCFTTDVIGTCIFGLDFNSFEDENSAIRTFVKKVFNPPLLLHLKRVFGTSFPKIATLLNISITPADISEFYMKLIQDTVNYRETNNHTRNDFIQLLIQLKNSGDLEHTFTTDDLAAESFGFFTAGYETSSTLMTFALYELARNQSIQDKVRKEVVTVLEDNENEVSYESVQEMKFLDLVIDETLRMHPPVPLLSRRCVENYKIPEEDVVIEEGTLVLLSILGLHYDEEYYPNAEKFDPDRFSTENRSLIPSYAYLPFGEGPRICIGKRFGLLQAKVGLSCLLKRFRFEVSSKTVEPLKIHPSGTTLKTLQEIWLDVFKI